MNPTTNTGWLYSPDLDVSADEHSRRIQIIRDTILPSRIGFTGHVSVYAQHDRKNIAEIARNSTVSTRNLVIVKPLSFVECDLNAGDAQWGALPVSRFA